MQEVENLPNTANSFDWFNMLTSGGPVAIATFILLIIFSVVTWGIILERWVSLKKMHTAAENFLSIFWATKNLSDLYSKVKDLPHSSSREVFRAGYNEILRIIQLREKKGIVDSPIQFDTVKRSLSKARNIEEANIAKYMSFLAISASASPFIGLFGTVVGIIKAFSDIAKTGATSLAAVAPGISEALIATALGLAAAIPAVIFYNVFSTKARKHLLLIDGFASDFLNILERHFNTNSVKGE